jgi:hypothetical protein
MSRRNLLLTTYGYKARVGLPQGLIQLWETTRLFLEEPLAHV